MFTNDFLQQGNMSHPAILSIKDEPIKMANMIKQLFLCSYAYCETSDLQVSVLPSQFLHPEA